MMNMNNEEFDRNITFIVEQQAQFASDIQLLQESQARTDQVAAQTAEVVGQMGEGMYARRSSAVFFRRQIE
jgi:hypothetical protein